MAIKKECSCEVQSFSLDELMTTSDQTLRSAIAKVKSLKQLGHISEAIGLLQDLEQMFPKENSVVMALGHLYWQQDDFLNASVRFRKATEIDPLMELASLSLYHTLWASGRREEALEEMKRFLQVSRSVEYDRILQSFQN